ncbi:hypothetical protein [Algibacter sp. 2305UL17-15]|uniref:hypothetical protein n=1 Tax=Algibacter sp. 2305UL17-15 TaxID=3231268 RepID=UPI00345AFA89
MAIDPDGKDVYLIIWFTKSGDIGHVGIAVDNYKKVEEKVMVNGIEVTNVKYVKDGTVTFYDFAPSEATNDVNDFDKNIRGYLSSLSNISVEEIKSDGGSFGLKDFFDVGGEQDSPADGLIQLYTSVSKDNIIKRNLEEQFDKQGEFINEESDEIFEFFYNGVNANCTGFVICPITDISTDFDEITALEHIKHDGGKLGSMGGVIEIPAMDITTETPNRLFQQLKKLVEQNPELGKVIRDAGGSRKPLIDALTNDRIKDKTPNN